VRYAPWLAFIGPAAAGKTSLGKRVAVLTGRPFVDLDAVAAPYYGEAGWSIPRLVERIHAVGRVAAEREWEPARAHAVERVVEDNPGAVIALGAGHTSYTDRDCSDRVRTALSRCLHVFFVLPNADLARSLDVLRHRSIQTKGTDWIFDGHDLLSEWLRDGVSRSMATRVVHTADEDPQQSAARVTGLAMTTAEGC
jgi:shikimate kinase